MSGIKIQKVKVDGKYIYAATILKAVKQATAGANYGKGLEEIIGHPKQTVNEVEQEATGLYKAITDGDAAAVAAFKELVGTLKLDDTTYSTVVAYCDAVAAKAQSTVEKALIQTKSGEKMLAVEEGTGDDAGKRFISSALSLDLGKRTLAEGETDDTEYLMIKGIGGVEIARLDATRFLKDGMLKKDGIAIVTPDNHDTVDKDYTVPTAWKHDDDYAYLMLTFNTDEGGSIARVDLYKFIDIYTAANVLLTSAYKEAESWTPDDVIKTGASLEAVIGQLVKGIKEAKASAGVTSVGGKTGAITLDGDNTEDGTVNLTISEGGEVQATITGIANYAKKADAISADSTGSTYTTVKVGGTVASPTVEVSETTATIASQATEGAANGLVLAADVYAYALTSEDVSDTTEYADVW